MQNIPQTPTPSGNLYAAPPPPEKKSGLSKGCIIGIVAAVLLGLGAIILIAVAAGGIYWFNRQAATEVNTKSATGVGTSSSSDSHDDKVEVPEPTASQAAAVSGGQTASWEQQEISWTVPQKWTRQSVDSRSFFWRSPGSSDAASLIVSISPMSADFPTETSINAFYTGAQTRQQNGEVDEVRWLKFGGLKGVQFRESAPEDADSPQRLQWMAYRTYKGQKQLINVMLATRGKDFARHEDALYGILYSMKLTE